MLRAVVRVLALAFVLMGLELSVVDGAAPKPKA